MTLPAWPSTVPATARDGWHMPSMYVAPSATEMEGGNQRLRSKPGSNVAIIEYPLVPLSLTEWGYLNTFIRTTLGNGASRFTMSLIIAGASVSKTVQLNEGKSPVVRQQDGLMHVTMQLRVYGL